MTALSDLTGLVDTATSKAKEVGTAVALNVQIAHLSREIKELEDLQDRFSGTYGDQPSTVERARFQSVLDQLSAAHEERQQKLAVLAMLKYGKRA